MRQSKTSFTANYLRPILADGAKPYLYRPQVRLLLGYPDNDGGDLAFSSVVPPVGFRYARHYAAGRPRSTAYAPDSSGFTVIDDPYQHLDAMQEAAEGNIPREHRKQTPHQENILMEQKEKIRTPQTSQPAQTPQTSKTAPTPRHGKGKGRVESGADPAGKGETGTLEPTASAGDREVARRRIDIPGFSAKQVSFPLLTPTGGDAGSSTSSTGSVPGSVSKPGVSGAAVSGPSQPGTGTRGKRPETGAHGAAVSAGEPAVDTGAAAAEVLTPGAREESDTGEGSGPQEGTNPVRQAKPRAADETPGAEEKSSGPRPGYQEAVRRIQHLRQEVHRLNLIASSGSGESPGENTPLKEEPHTKKSKPPSQPVQRVKPRVVSRRRSGGRRIPCAFWERNSLSRFHLPIPG